MCRSSSEGGRRCTGTSSATQSTPAPTAIEATRTTAGAPLPRLSKARFLATHVQDLAAIDGDTIHIAPRPAGMSDSAYRDHLASGPRIHMRTRDGDTRDLPERLWGGTSSHGNEPVTAMVVAADARRRGDIVTMTWEPAKPKGYDMPGYDPGLDS